MTTTDPGYSGHATQGDQYDGSRYVPAAEIARNTRAQIKAAQKAGTLPADVTFAVRSQRYAGGQSVHIFLYRKDVDGNAWAYRPVTDSHEDAQAAYHNLTTVVREDVREWAATVKGYARRYTREDVDSMVDYFDVSCYVFAYLGRDGGRSL